MLGGNTEHIGTTRLRGNTKQKTRKPPIQVRRVQPAKKLLTKSLGISLESLCNAKGAIKGPKSP